MGERVTLDRLWASAPATSSFFDAQETAELPKAAQRYLSHTISPETSLAQTVRLRMRGDIKLKQWRPFTAEQVISWPQGMIWQATAWLKGLPIQGRDQVVNGAGEMRWKLLGLFPVIVASGPNITCSALGRMMGECIWLPSVLYSADWTAIDLSHTRVELTLAGETTQITLQIAPNGQLEQFYFQRWGNPDGRDYRYETFGGKILAEASFAGYTIPTQLEAGWYFGSPQYESEGKFFRVRLDNVTYC